MRFDRKDIPDAQLLQIYRSILYPRLVEERMLVLLRQGRVSKWFSGIGQEAISVGATCAVDPGDWIFPLHRNLGVFTSRQVPLDRLARQWMGFADGFTKGRDRSFHFGTADYHICGMISHLGPQLAVADGVALAHRLRKENQVCLAFTGEGATSEGDFHEALNLASVWDLPVIFIIENNGYALSTPVEEQFRCESLVSRAAGYGMDGVRIDGNNILEVYDTVRGVREYCRSRSRPYLIECTTFRMRGHEEASGTRYVPEYLFEIWKRRDPVQQYEEFIKSEGLLREEDILSMHAELKHQIEEELESAFHGQPPSPDPLREEQDVFAQTRTYTFADISPIRERDGDLRYVDAIREGIHLAMQQHGQLVIMGQDIAAYGGVFKVTEGLAAEFGEERVRNTPLCESAVLGAALGLSIAGHKSMVEMQFSDFASSGFTQIVNNIAKIHYRWGQPADLVIRMPAGGSVGAGPFHSQSMEAWFAHTPGLKLVYPATARDAKGLLLAAVNDPNPVMYFEHKALYRAVSDPVPADYYEVEIGRASCIEAGEELSVITWGLGVHWALEYAREHPDISMDLLDLRTLIPLDHAAIRASVRRTGKVLVLHEATLTAGFGAEVAAWIGEHCFDLLDAPVMRCASLDTPVPFNARLEAAFLAKSRLDAVIRRLLEY